MLGNNNISPRELRKGRIWRILPFIFYIHIQYDVYSWKFICARRIARSIFHLVLIRYYIMCIYESIKSCGFAP